MIVLLASLAFAAEPIHSTAVTGVTATQIATATAPVKVATFTYTKVTWDVKCYGPSTGITCAVSTSTAGKTAAVVGGSGHTLNVKIDGAVVPVVVDGISIDTILGIK